MRLHGRDSEQRVLREVVRAAADGSGTALVLRGEPGTGRTALLDWAATALSGAGSGTDSGSGTDDVGSDSGSGTGTDDVGSDSGSGSGDVGAGPGPVLRCACVPAETVLPYAGLIRLLRPLFDLVDHLPQPERGALREALGLADGGADADTTDDGHCDDSFDGVLADPDRRFLVGPAVRSLLAEAARRSPCPLLCLVDDAHWLDEASAEALVLAGRRLSADPVALILAMDDDPADPLPAPRLRTLPLTGLTPTAASALLSARRRDLPEPARQRLLAGSGGNPLALLELPPGADGGPLSDRLIRTFAARIRELPAPTRRALLLAAAEGTGDMAVVREAGAAPGALALAGGLTRDDGALRHPLVAVAVLRTASPDERRAAHAALATVLKGRPGCADRRAWQLAWAAPGPDEADETVAQELERTARRALRRGGREAAARAYEEAARLSTEPAVRARRLVPAAECWGGTVPVERAGAAEEASAARATGTNLRPGGADRRASDAPRAETARAEGVLTDPGSGTNPLPEAAGRHSARTAAGQTDAAPAGQAGGAGLQPGTAGPRTPGARAQAAAEQAEAILADPAGGAGALPGTAQLRARAARVRAAEEFAQGRPGKAHALLIEGARGIGGTDPGLELRMRLGAVEAAWAAGDVGMLAVTADGLDAARLPDGDPLVPVGGLLGGLVALPLGRPLPPGGLPPLAEAVAGAREGGVGAPDEVALILGAGLVTGHERETRDVASAVAEEARADGRLGLLTVALALRATAEVLLGEHARAGASGREALDLARDTGQDRWARHVCGVLAYLAAVGGDRTGCRVLAAEALGGTPGFGRAGTTWAHWALTVLDLGAGHLDAALARLDIAAPAPARFDPPFSRGLPDLIEALVALGHTPEARELTRRVSAWALRLNLPAAEALLARCRALVAVTDAEAETYFRTALELHAADPRPFDRARTELSRARWLHHRHRVRDAVPHLAAARAAFVRLQAAPWSAQAAKLAAGSAGLMAGARGGSVPDR
ncbi:AAA family ATPase [Actinacidiphila acididurans]|uniref:ATP-binding protein n=1 Tax=Actinacidiphila acididurans TaxID=2784346 RepID=A0ABS2TRL5_9ACTN|nr:AAA family ATPase [Actinacidiphila acididurans]MBM9505982.1 ATP-binding protein [Actinacidiphila acididurans]